MANILVLNGPNLNQLGTREPEIYGSDTLDDIDRRLQQQAVQAGHQLQSFQSNAEHQLIERIHQARGDGTAFMIINAASFTHTSIGIRDALKFAGIPFIEIHISNVFAREPFRHQSFLSDIAEGIICGLGPVGYELALQAACHRLGEQ